MKYPVVAQIPSDINSIPRWLNGFKQVVFDAFSTVFDYDVVTVIPEKPRVGMTVYFGLGTPAPITHEGLWVYTSTGWKACNS